MATTGIEWTATQNADGTWTPGKTWNPVVGCTKISAGCKNCYAKTLHDQRHKAHGEGKKVPAQYAHPFEVVQLLPDRLRDPLSWKKPARVFVNSVSDLFHDEVPYEFLDRVFAVMGLAGRHTFQVLTKRPERMAAYVNRLGLSITPLENAAREMGYTFKFRGVDGEEHSNLAFPLPNVWLGTSVENQAAADERVPHLLATPAPVRFLSCEPLLGPVSLTDQPWWDHRSEHAFFKAAFPGARPPLDWVIVGGESGAGARPMQVQWARSLVEQCKAAGVACFVKQLGAHCTARITDVPEAMVKQARSGGQADTAYVIELGLKDKKGGDPVEWPEELRVREFPRGG